MSDSDCSNCGDFKCKYRLEDHYNCYKIKIDILKKVVNKKDIKYLFDLMERIKRQEEEDYRNINITSLIEEILFDIKEALGGQ
jgi:hypothetical protein